MGKHDSIKGPYFAPIIFRLESFIAAEDRQTHAAGTLTLKDSAVKSALRKAELALAGKPPKKAPEGALEEWTAALARTFVNEGRAIVANGEATLNEAIACLSVLRESLDTRRSMSPGNPRAYLEFLESFMAQIADPGDTPLS